MRPVICLITDQRRAVGGAAALVDRVAVATRAGVDLVQIRERDLEGGELSRLVARCVAAVRGTRARVIVNDRLDVAVASGAHGVHLRGDSFPAPRGRAVVPSGFLVGRSVHTAEGTTQASVGTDYLIFGTTFTTESKPGRPAAGTTELRLAVNATSIPVLAVGGVTSDNVSEIARAGAAGIAAISLFSDCSLDVLAARVEAVGRAFGDAWRA